MEPNEKPKFNWQRMLITTGIVLFAALAAGGTTWYVMDKSAKDIKTANDKSVAELQRQIDELKTTPKTTAPTTPTLDPTADWKTYTNSGLAISFKYPTKYTPADMTSTFIGNDTNQLPWYDQSSFAKLYLQLNNTKTDTITAKIIESTDMDKVLESFGGGTPSKTIVTYGNYKGYVATAYGQATSSTNIVYTLVGTKYSIALMSVNPNDSDTLKTIIESVKFN